ncbi:hypothetical protein [Qaidamihabitans albus]|uniref:hypothetical protein n=1 Tax=Qaidamihabitans albus TaxID=2795733 RepID=UPI001F1EE14A|nr:hypothetical protein [Qaidamihabitans albus]
MGLAFGDIDLGAEIMARLPFGSAVFAGVALALVVAVPMTVAAYLCATGHRHAPLSAIVAGAALVGWIAVQIGVVRSYSWLQPVSAFAGLVVMLAGLRAFPRVGDITSSRRS